MKPVRRTPYQSASSSTRGQRRDSMMSEDTIMMTDRDMIATFRPPSYLNVSTYDYRKPRLILQASSGQIGCGRHSVAGSDSTRPKSAPRSSVAPAGLWDRIGYWHPPLKRWAIVDRPCGADGLTQEDWGAVEARRATENSPAIHRWGTGAKDKNQSRKGRKRGDPHTAATRRHHIPTTSGRSAGIPSESETA